MFYAEAFDVIVVRGWQGWESTRVEIPIPF